MDIIIGSARIDENGNTNGGNPGLANMSCFERNDNKTGSNLIKAIQKRIGATQNGWIGYDTIIDMQKWLGTKQDGVISNPSNMVKALQTWCNNQ